MKLGLMLIRPPYTYQDLDTAYHLTKAALEKNHEVKIFLYVDSVIVANKEINSGSERNLAKKFGELTKLGVEVKICGVCVQYRGIKRSQLIEKGELEGLPGLADLIKECDKFVSI